MAGRMKSSSPARQRIRGSPNLKPRVPGVRYHGDVTDQKDSASTGIKAGDEMALCPTSLMDRRCTIVKVLDDGRVLVTMTGWPEQPNLVLELSMIQPPFVDPRGGAP